jgi:hypothetical protein
MRLSRKVRAAAAGALLFAAANLHAECAKDPECDDVMVWSRFTAFTLDLSEADSPPFASWQAQFDHKQNDIVIDLDVKTGKGRMKGAVAMVGGRVMLSKGLTLEPGYEIDALDGPVLSMKVVMILLGRIYPGGPDSISGEKRIDHRGKVGIKYATQSASGYIAAPWRVTGKVAKDAKGGLAYDLSLTSPREPGDKRGGTYTMRMQGVMSVLGRPVFLDSTPLDGWTTYGVGPRTEKKGGTTTMDYGATPDTSPRFKAVGDIRAYIAEEDNPGVRDSTKDFTGFWKTKCEQAFGLQIMHYGPDGKYSIVFCGPGGCGDPAEGRLTFITGDKSFEVVSEDELIQIGRSGDRDRNVRCTKDPHPVLKY